MITISKNPYLPAFSRIYLRDGADISRPGFDYNISLSSYGACVTRAIYWFGKRFPAVRVKTSMIMPDHIHLHVDVTHSIVKDLSWYMSEFKSRCTKNLNNIYPETHGISLFDNNFHDRIIFSDRQLADTINYIKENPRRYLIKKSCPDFFYSQSQITVGEETYAARGNTFLLSNPSRTAVKWSRAYSPEKWYERYCHYDEIIRQRGVLISPYINPVEKEIMRMALDGGASIIYILPDGMPERFAPWKELFPYTAEGRVLFVAPPEHHTEKQPISYQQCDKMNRLAFALSGEDTEGWFRIPSC